MTSRISGVFRPGYKALIPYITVGYPDLGATVEAGCLLAENGCDVIELGIPFSDPLADGVTIQNASFRALKNGITPGICLDVAGKLARRVKTPLVFMTYFNPVLNYGLEAFCRACLKSGVSGLIVPDLPPEEGSELEDLTRESGLDLIYLLAPTSTGTRIKLVTEKSRGFIYLVSVTGVTGARARLPESLSAFIGRVREVTLKPLCVGFGISTPEQAKEVAQLADGIIIGSKIIQLQSDGNPETLRDFVRGVKSALSGA